MYLSPSLLSHLLKGTEKERYHPFNLYGPPPTAARVVYIALNRYPVVIGTRADEVVGPYIHQMPLIRTMMQN